MMPTPFCEAQPVLCRASTTASQSSWKIKYANNLKGVERAEECMMKELQDYATEGYDLQSGSVCEWA